MQRLIRLMILVVLGMQVHVLAAASEVCEGLYKYEEYGAAGDISIAAYRWSGERWTESYRPRKGGPVYSLGTYCPFEGPTELCSLSSSRPFLVPTNIPESKSVTINTYAGDQTYELEGVERTGAYEFNYQKIGADKSEVGSSDTYRLGVSVRVIGNSDEVIFRFAFWWDSEKGVTAYAPVRSEITAGVGEGGGFHFFAKLISDIGIGGECET